MKLNIYLSRGNTVNCSIEILVASSKRRFKEDPRATTIEAGDFPEFSQTNYQRYMRLDLSGM